MRFDKEAQARNILWEKIQGFGEGLNEKKREIEPFTMISWVLGTITEEGAKQISLDVLFLEHLNY